MTTTTTKRDRNERGRGLGATLFCLACTHVGVCGSTWSAFAKWDNKCGHMWNAAEPCASRNSCDSRSMAWMHGWIYVYSQGWETAFGIVPTQIISGQVSGPKLIQLASAGTWMYSSAVSWRAMRARGKARSALVSKSAVTKAT